MMDGRRFTGRSHVQPGHLIRTQRHDVLARVAGPAASAVVLAVLVLVLVLVVLVLLLLLLVLVLVAPHGGLRPIAADRRNKYRSSWHARRRRHAREGRLESDLLRPSRVSSGRAEDGHAGLSRTRASHA